MLLCCNGHVPYAWSTPIEEEYKDPSHQLLSQERRTPIQNAVTNAVLVH